MSLEARASSLSDNNFFALENFRYPFLALSGISFLFGQRFVLANKFLCFSRINVAPDVNFCDVNKKELCNFLSCPDNWRVRTSTPRGQTACCRSRIAWHHQKRQLQKTKQAEIKTWEKYSESYSCGVRTPLLPKRSCVTEHLSFSKNSRSWICLLLACNKKIQHKGQAAQLPQIQGCIFHRHGKS